MANVTRSATPGIDEIEARKAPQIAGDLFAGEDLQATDLCYISGTDGLVYRTNGTALNTAARFDGMVFRTASAGQPVTLVGIGCRFKAADGTLTPGQFLYPGTVAGQLADAATTGGTYAVARAINAYDARLIVNAG